MLPKIVRKLKSPFVYLTFDDGPNPDVTPQLLDLLASINIRATFFLEGRKAKQFPEIVKSISSGGHVIGNHSYNHPKMLFKSRSFLSSEIKKTDNVLAEITGKKVVLFRPPYGLFGPALLTVLKETNHKMILWSKNIKDYEEKTSKQQIQNRIAKSCKQGHILLMHDGHANSVFTLQALKDSLETMLDNGVTFSTIPE